jgi:hypothetical protein
MEVDVVYSTATVSRSTNGRNFLPKDNLVTTANPVLDAGIQVAMSYRTPDNGCDGVSGLMLCQLVAKCIGNGASIKIGGHVKTDTGAIGLFAAVDNVRLSPTLLLSEAKIFVEATATSAGVGLSGLLQHTAEYGDILYYTGQIRADIANGVPTLQMAFTSRGMWKNLFGQDYLALGDAYLTAGISIVPPPVLFAPTSFGIGGKIQMGSACATQPSACITASCYVRIDLVNPAKGNFLQFETSALTFSTMVDTLANGGNVSKLLPTCIQHSGFPKGVFASFAGSAQTLPNGIAIKEGMRFKGELEFLGYLVSANIVFVPTKSLDLDIAMEPLVVLGGEFAVTEKINDFSTGPRFKLSLNFGQITQAWYKQLASPPKLSAAAAVSVLGFAASAAVEIGFDKFSVEATGSLFGGWIIAQVGQCLRTCARTRSRAHARTHPHHHTRMPAPCGTHVTQHRAGQGVRDARRVWTLRQSQV